MGHSKKDSCDDEHVEVADLATVLDSNDVNSLPVSWFVWLVAVTASLAGWLFGYDTGIISAVLVYLHDDLNGQPTTSNEKQLITSLCSNGAFFGAIVAGLTADKVHSPPIVFPISTDQRSLDERQPFTSVASCSSLVLSCKLPHTLSPKCPSVDLSSGLVLGLLLWSFPCISPRLHRHEPAVRSSGLTTCLLPVAK